jgi:2'-5' RNA ligase
MPSTLRAFIAAKIPCTPDLRDVLRELGRMGRAIRPTQEDSLHLTLKFLGDTLWEQTADIAQAMRGAAQEVPSVEALLYGLGAFPNPARPSVIWAGIEPADDLVLLAGRLDERLADLGFAPEARAFHAHVTLGRVKFRPPEALTAVLSRLRDATFGDVAIESIELYQSEPSPAGSRYTVLAAAQLR